MLQLNGCQTENCGVASWCSTLDAAPMQRVLQVGEERIQPPVDVERCGKAHQSRDLLRGQLVDEAKLEEEQVGRKQIAERVPERAVQLRRAKRRVGATALRRTVIVKIELFGHEVLEASARLPLLASAIVRGASIASAVQVEADSSRDDHEPGGDFAPWSAGELVKPAIVIGSQMLEHLRIRVHRVVVRAPYRAAHVQDQPTVIADEYAPFDVRIVRGPRLEETRQRGRKADVHRQTVIGHRE
jgi:hypothetical protein